jgi:hypothetical protein
MEAKNQEQIVFYLTGRRDGSTLHSFENRFRPALMSRYSEMSTLRYDFPLVLNRKGTSERAVLSLSKMVDAAVGSMVENPGHDRVARHGYRIESELRRELAEKGPGDFATMWHSAAARAADAGDETLRDSAMVLWKAFDVDGDLFDADAALPSRALHHAWTSIQSEKAAAFRNRAERLLLKLKDILSAEVVGSAVGRAPERLRAGVGASFAGTFDFAAMSRILVEAKPSFELTAERRERVQSLIEVLENQRFYPLGSNGPETYNFAFGRCSDALTAYQERHDEAVLLVRTLAVAELEAKGEYRESVHNIFFEAFGANGLDAAELAELPFYLICTDGRSLDAAEMSQLIELLAAGVPVKVLVQTDDVLEPSAVAEGHVALGLRARQLVNTAIGLTDVFVYQSSSSHLYKKRDSLVRGLVYNGPALFSVFSGVNGHTGDVPAYLVSAAANESRVFPSIVYDPSAGSDWATRLTVDDNPSPDDDWTVHTFAYEDSAFQARTESLAFTLADFMAMDERFRDHYAIVGQDDWSDSMITVPEALKTDLTGLTERVPCIAIVNDKGVLTKAIIDDRTLAEVRRCLTMWHSLQELGGIHNSHAERLIAAERNAAVVVLDNSTVVAEGTPEPVAEAVTAEPAAAEHLGDDPYIETPRCTSCNECTILNNKMFAYNAEKQAYVADPDAGTFRQLVEAAEGCQVSIIHPGKPRNPKEPGLEDLLVRAAVFN